MNDASMSFIEHLAELRARLVKGLIAFVVFTIVGYIFRGPILEIIKRPLGEAVPLHAFDIFEPFFASLRIAAYTGLFFGLPFLIYEILMFCLPGLKPNEKRVVIGGLSAGIVLLYGGMVFAYYLILPLLIPQLQRFFTEGVEQTLSITVYVDRIFRFAIAFGLGFQLPIVLIILVRLGVVTIEGLRKNRKYMIIAIFAVAAILTPPDVLSQVILAVPLLALYEISIWVSVLLARKERSA